MEAANPPSSNRRALATGAGLFVLAAALRVAFVLSVAQHHAVRLPMVDSRAYHAKALRILSGDWLGDAIFYQDPLFPYLLAGLYGLLGEGSVGVLIAQSLLDAGTVVLIFALAHRVFDFRCAVVAGLLAVFYKPFFYYDALLLKVALTVFSICLALLLLVVAAGRDRSGQWLAAGFALGFSCLSRGNYLIFAGAVLVWIWLETAGPRAARLSRCALVVCGLALAIAPVALRNAWVGGDLVLITSQAGPNFYIGNYRGNDSGRYRAPPFVRANPFYEETDFRAEAARRTGGKQLGASELSRFWLWETVREIGADPGHFLRHTLRKAALLFNHYEVPASQNYYFFREQVAPVLKLPGPGWGVLLPFVFYGMGLAYRRREARLLALFFVVYALSVIVTFNMSRYRMPLVPVAILFASVGIVQLVALARARRTRQLAVVVLGLAVATAWVHRDLTHDDFAGSHLNLGKRHHAEARRHRIQARSLARSGDLEAAERERQLGRAAIVRAEGEYRAAQEIRPHQPGLADAFSELSLDAILDDERGGRMARARERAEALNRAFPSFADGHVARGRVEAALGHYPEARAALRRALRLEPGHPEAIAELRFVGALAPAEEAP